jgi:hypothetical protein
MCSRVCGIGPSAAATNQDRAVHLGSTGDHVLHIVSVTWAVNVSVVTIVEFIFNVRSVDGDTTSFFFWRAVDLVECHEQNRRTSEQNT